jgi:hypothetical protein
METLFYIFLHYLCFMMDPFTRYFVIHVFLKIATMFSDYEVTACVRIELSYSAGINMRLSAAHLLVQYFAK